MKPYQRWYQNLGSCIERQGRKCLEGVDMGRKYAPQSEDFVGSFVLMAPTLLAGGIQPLFIPPTLSHCLRKEGEGLLLSRISKFCWARTGIALARYLQEVVSALSIQGLNYLVSPFKQILLHLYIGSGSATSCKGVHPCQEQCQPHCLHPVLG